MAKSLITTLPLQVNGTNHTVEITKNKKMYSVTIDGQEYKTFSLGKKSILGMIPHEDFPMEVQGEQFILALRSDKIRLAKDGKYMNNDEAFTPAIPLPIWVWIFVVASLGLFVGGAIGGGLGAGAALGCLSVSRQNKPIAARIGICVAITAGCWIIYLLIAGLIEGIFK